MKEIYLLIYIALGVFVAYRYRRNYFHPVPFITAYWLITFPFKFIVYEDYADYVVGGYVESDLRTDSLGWSLSYYTIMLASYFLFARRRKFNLPLFNRISERKLKILFFIGLFIFLTLNIPLLISGDIVIYLSNRTESYFGDGFYKVFGSNLLFLSTLAILFQRSIVFRGDRTDINKKKLTSWVYVAIGIGLMFLVLEMVRGKLFIIILSILYIQHQYVRPIKLRKLILFALIGLIALGAASQIKYVLVQGQFFSKNETPFIERVIGGLLVSFDSFDHLNQVITIMPIEVSESIFQPFLDPLIANVPRAIWNEKPVELGGLALQRYIYPDLYNENGVVSSYYSASGVGEAILLGGLSGVIFYSFYVGWLLSVIARLSDNNAVGMVIYIVAVGNLFNVARAGVYSLNSVMINFIFFIIPLVVISLIFSTSKASHRL